MQTLKKITTVFLTLTFILATVTCKKEVKKTPAKFSIEPQTITINWTGYKTTEKIAVNGIFEKINILKTGSIDTSAIGILNGTQFEIPVSSLFSKDSVRDSKLKDLFFGVMDATNSLKGTLNLNGDGNGTIDLRMNNVQHQIPISYIISEQLVELNGTLNFEDFNLGKALASLNEACFELHKGPDGVSKTWPEAAIGASIYLNKKAE
ncbi:MAG: polyisoprenoid-binding protein [Flavobacteriales bacterium]|nr:MAG: polyisoprenoid-binding protein [Flavobacteriales bacterium]PIE49061.1 MAG: polyisoprenoid-binding protein [Flavobacteriales bacterium]